MKRETKTHIDNLMAWLEDNMYMESDIEFSNGDEEEIRTFSEEAFNALEELLSKVKEN